MGFLYIIYGLYQTNKVHTAGDVKKDCTCFPSMTYADFQDIEKCQNAIYEEDENSEEALFYDGLI